MGPFILWFAAAFASKLAFGRPRRWRSVFRILFVPFAAILVLTVAAVLISVAG